jgi:uncharacterized protein
MSIEPHLPGFQAYQRAFTDYVRDPKQKMPKGVVARRMKVYAEIVFNNLFESVSVCYPVSSKVLGKRAWKKLVRGFFSDYQSDTPIFREIPEQFLHYLNSPELNVQDDLPPYLASLAHYEWVELAVSTMQVPDLAEVNPQGDLLANQSVLNPALEILSYDYPVQLISPRIKPSTPLANPVHLLVYRNAEFQVKFIETNPVTARLLALLQTGEHTGQTALEIIAEELQHPEPQVIVSFGVQILQDLQAQGVILGVKLG